MDMDCVVFDSHSAGQQAAMDVDTHLGIEKKLRKKGLKRKQFDAPLVRCIGVLLDGTKFDCSVDRGSSSDLEIGQVQLVIKEGDEGIKTILNASPPNATLQIGVECLSWSSAEDNCKDGSMLKDEREKCKENLKELAKFEASPEDGTSLVLKSERVDFTVNDGKFFEAAKKMKKGEVVVLTAKSQDGFPKLAFDGEGDVPLNATPSTLELVSWKTFAEATEDNKVLNKIVKGGEVCESPNDGTMEEEDDSDSAFVSHHLYGCATAEEAEKRRYERYKRYKERCRRIAEVEKEAKKAWERDFGSWFSLYLAGEVSGDWRDSYRIYEDGFVATFDAPAALDGLDFSDSDDI